MKMTFEDLDAWKKAQELVNAVYAITRRSSLSKDFGYVGKFREPRFPRCLTSPKDLNASIRQLSRSADGALISDLRSLISDL
jgi:hypothetical protein